MYVDVDVDIACVKCDTDFLKLINLFIFGCVARHVES